MTLRPHPDGAAELPKCPRCFDMGSLPCRMDAPGGPVCACGKPSAHEGGGCADVEQHGPVLCDCEAGVQFARALHQWGAR